MAAGIKLALGFLVLNAATLSALQREFEDLESLVRLSLEEPHDTAPQTADTDSVSQFEVSRFEVPESSGSLDSDEPKDIAPPAADPYPKLRFEASRFEASKVDAPNPSSSFDLEKPRDTALPEADIDPTPQYEVSKLEVPKPFSNLDMEEPKNIALADPDPKQQFEASRFEASKFATPESSGSLDVEETEDTAPPAAGTRFEVSKNEVPELSGSPDPEKPQDTAPSPTDQDFEAPSATAMTPNQPRPPLYARRQRGFYQERGFSCSFRERLVLKPVHRLMNNIKGKVTSSVTIMPMRKPPRCSGNQHMSTLRQCYYAWGFTKPTSECFAQEQASMEPSCEGICPPNTGIYSNACQNCWARLRQVRLTCMFKSMNIRPQCQNCQIQAYKYWDSHCMMECKDVFRVITLHKDRNGATSACRHCNDIAYKMLEGCGL